MCVPARSNLLARSEGANSAMPTPAPLPAQDQLGSAAHRELTWAAKLESPAKKIGIKEFPQKARRDYNVHNIWANPGDFAITHRAAAR
jgi:hypothetical protein